MKKPDDIYILLSMYEGLYGKIRRKFSSAHWKRIENEVEYALDTYSCIHVIKDNIYRRLR